MESKSSGVAFSFLIFAFVALVVISVFASKSSSSGLSSSAPIVLPDFKTLTVDWSNAELLLLPPANCRKKALLFGLNYRNTPNELKGCIEDVRNLGDVLRNKGFDVEICTDDSAAKPTLAVLQAKLAAFLLDLAPNDVAIVWYSGHGVLLEDGSNAWVPLDFKTSGFVDEALVRANLEAVNESVRLFIGTDACHSGTSFNLKFDVEPKVVKSLPVSFQKVANTRQLTRKTLQHKDIDTDTQSQTDPNEIEMLDMFPISEAMQSHIVVLSASRDEQTSQETFEDGEMQGAMTWAFLDALQTKTNSITLAQLQNEMRAQLKENAFTQIPQLSFSKLFSPLTQLSAFGF